LLEDRFEAAVFSAVTNGVSGSRPTKPSGLSWIDEIPTEWGTPPVSANFDLQLGKMVNAEATAGPDQYSYLRNTNVKWDRFDFDDLNTMHFSASDKRRCELRDGDVLVCEGGEVGRAAVWSRQRKNCYYQKAIHRVRPRNAANGRYLMYCLRAAAKVSVFAMEGNQSTIVHLTGEQLRVHRFPWPSADEQDLIVQVLDEAATLTGAAISTVTRQIDLLVEHRQALVTAAVTGTISIPGATAA
jgi:type I restriction enzyme S subunit